MSVRTATVAWWILLIGVGLRIGTGLAPGSLWFDELATALNVTERGWGEVLAPLGYRQIVPLGFLMAEMGGVSLLGRGEIGLRLFPLVVSIASLFLFWRVATRYLSGVSLCGALGLFAVSPALVWYSRKAKQYAGDVCVTLVLLLLAVRFLEGRGTMRHAWIAGTLGAVSILFSQPAVFVAAGLFAVLMVEAWRSRSPLLPPALLGCLWGFGCVLQVITTLRLTPPATQDFMSDAWQGAFLPVAGDSSRAILWLPRTLFDFIGFIVGLMEPDVLWEGMFLGVYALLMAIGAVYLVRTRRVLAMLLITPLAVAILASALRVLPLNGRLMIYVGPTLILACLAGVEAIRARLGRRTSVTLTAALVAAPAAFLPFLLTTLIRHEDSAPVLRQVREEWREGDVMYVYEGAEMAMRFYGAPLGLTPWIAGRGRGPDPHALLQDVDTLRGHPRAWFFYTHGVGCKPALIRSYLQTIGTETLRIDDPHGVRGMHETAASLYDLADPERLSSSSAADHPRLERSDPRCRAGERVGARIRDGLRAFVAGLAGE